LHSGGHFRLKLLRPRGRQVRARLRDGHLRIRGVDDGDEIALLHRIPEVDRQIHNPSRDVGLHIHHLPRLDGAGRRDGGPDVAPLHGPEFIRFAVGLSASGALEPYETADRDQGDKAGDDQAPARS